MMAVKTLGRVWGHAEMLLTSILPKNQADGDK